MAIQPVNNSELIGALNLIFRDLAPDERKQRLASTLIEYQQNPKLFQGLLVERDQNGISGAIWVVEMAGKTAVTGLPVEIPNSSSACSKSLLQAANVFCDANGMTLNQIVLDATQNDRWHNELSTNGYDISVELEYFVCPHKPDASQLSRNKSPNDATPLELKRSSNVLRSDTISLTSLANSPSHVVEPIVQSTFVDSTDVPELANRQRIEEMLDGYEATGDSGKQWWSAVEVAGDTAGCLLLGSRTLSGQMEIVYIGLKPEFRGMGISSQALRAAMHQDYGFELNEWVVAVDARNRFAVNLYRSCGFSLGDRRWTKIRLSSREDART